MSYFSKVFSLLFFFLINRCDAEPIALARYVLALVGKDKPLDKLRENCVDRLEVFLDRGKTNILFIYFVTKAFPYFLFNSNQRFC